MTKNNVVTYMYIPVQLVTHKLRYILFILYHVHVYTRIHIKFCNNEKIHCILT